MKFKLTFLLVLASFSLPALAQQATITYTQDFPGSDPSHFMVSISSDGHGMYEGNGRLVSVSEKYATDDSVPDNEKLEFTPSAAFVAKMFDLAKHADYFQGELDSKKRNLAFTGKKSLAYTDATRNTSQTYNYSVSAEVTELTRNFQNLSNTLEYGRRLEYCHRHQKLALDEQTKLMEASAKGGNIVELSTIAPIVQQIIDDRAVLNVVRLRLQKIMAASAGQ